MAKQYEYTVSRYVSSSDIQTRLDYMGRALWKLHSIVRDEHGTYVMIFERKKNG